jgi:hypothetical protein
MMPIVKKALSTMSIPLGSLFDIETASFYKDTHEATDLILKFPGGDLGVRVRGFRYGSRHVPMQFDWSVRFRSKCGGRTEIDKFRDGYCRWYFISRANEDETDLFGYGLIDLNKCREIGLFRDELWEVNPNDDGSAGGYMPLWKVHEYGCLLWPINPQFESKGEIIYKQYLATAIQRERG